MKKMEIRPATKWQDPTSLMDRRTEEDDVVACVECGCRWMELICVQQFQKYHHVILGQRPPTKYDVGFWIFRCPKCGEVYEPSVHSGPQDAAHKQYAKFVKEMIERDVATKR